MNKIIFENGIEHEFTADEFKMLKVCIAVLANDKILLNNSLSRIDANRFKWDKYYLALKQLYSLFLHQSVEVVEYRKDWNYESKSNAQDLLFSGAV